MSGGYKVQRRARLKKMGLSEEDYSRILREQDGKCAICRTSELILDRVLAVDHDHKTRKIRGLLCTRCNVALGALQDDPEIVLSAYRYLVAWRERQR